MYMYVKTPIFPQIKMLKYIHVITLIDDWLECTDSTIQMSTVSFFFNFWLLQENKIRVWDVVYEQVKQDINVCSTQLTFSVRDGTTTTMNWKSWFQYLNKQIIFSIIRLFGICDPLEIKITYFNILTSLDVTFCMRHQKWAVVLISVTFRYTRRQTSR
mgnify:FL=1